MTDQSRLLAGQLLNELEEINQDLNDSLDLDNLGRTGSLPTTNKQAKSLAPETSMLETSAVDPADKEPISTEFDESILEEFTQAMCGEAESLAELYFSEGLEDDHAINSQLIKTTIENIAEFNLKLLTKYLSSNNQQETTNEQPGDNSSQKQLPVHKAQAF